MVIYRVQSGQPYRKRYSSDGGRSWSAVEALPFGSVRPKLLRAASGNVLLAGGRPGLFVWLGDPSGEQWSAVNVAELHNALILNASTSSWPLPRASMLYSESFINCSLRTSHTMSTAYTSLLQVTPAPVSIGVSGHLPQEERQRQREQPAEVFLDILGAQAVF